MAMQFCREHWDNLQVSKSGAEAVTRHAEDPLMVAHNLILVVAMQRYGPGNFQCPWCAMMADPPTDGTEEELLRMIVADAKRRCEAARAERVAKGVSGV